MVIMRHQHLYCILSAVTTIIAHPIALPQTYPATSASVIDDSVLRVNPFSVAKATSSDEGQKDETLSYLQQDSLDWNPGRSDRERNRNLLVAENSGGGENRAGDLAVR